MTRIKTFILLILIFSSVTSYCQKYVLLNNELSKPPLLSDTANTKQLNSGYTGFLRSDLDSIIVVLNSLKDYFPPIIKKKNKNIQIKINKAAFFGERIHLSYGDRYDINLYSFTNEISGKLIISNSRFSNKVNIKRLNDLISYCSLMIRK